jgi:inosine-uridine nucleoside N-ribohydrolase
MIIDVDTGVDDAMAIFYAARRPCIKLEALTTTFGPVRVVTDRTELGEFVARQPPS